MEVQYDSCNRLIYHPEFHPNHGKPMTEKELEYLCKYYDFDGAKSISMGLGRTEKAVAYKVQQLKKDGRFEYYKHLNKHW